MIKLFTSILITPSNGWEEAKKLETKRDVIIKYALPLVLTAGVCAFCGTLLETGAFEWRTGLKRFTLLTISLSASFYIAAIIIQWMSRLFMSRHLQFAESLQFTIFSFSCVIFVVIAAGLIEDIFFIWVLDLYTVYLVFVGCDIYLGIKGRSTDKRNAFIVLSSLTIIAMNPAIEKILTIIMPGLN